MKDGDNTMKAIVHTQYGPADELQLKEMRNPQPKDNEVLVKVHATTVTTTDCNIRNFTFVPRFMRFPVRMQYGYRNPKNNILGLDMSGEIEAVGRDIKQFQTGDEVFGTLEPAMGAHAEYICMPQDGVLVKKPSEISHRQAAPTATAGITALYFLRDLGNIQPGHNVLINGASGAVGSYAVQLAKFFGAQVTGICSTANLKLVRSLGADSVIDYINEDFTQNGKTYDIIFDVAGKSLFSRCRRSLRQGGVFLAPLPTLPVLLHMILTSLFSRKKVKMGGALANIEDLIFLKDRLKEGDIAPVIGSTYPLEQTAEGFKNAESGHKKGNTIIKVV